MIMRVKKLNFLTNIIIATTTNPKDEKIVSIAKKLKVNFFKGSENNVLDRVIKSAEKFNSDLIIRATSDCPVIDLDLVDQAYKMYLNNRVDYLSNGMIRSYPLGMDVEIFKLSTLKKSLKFAKTPDCKEHITLAIRKYPNVFKHLKIIAPKSIYYPNLSLTLDYKEDAILLKKIINFFWGKKYNCLDLIKFLKRNKKIVKTTQKLKRTVYNF
jgi:spore coat polysaccharide biosynthesis protein SpsF